MYINTTWKQFRFIFLADAVCDRVLQSACGIFCCIIPFVMTGSRSYLRPYLNPTHTSYAARTLSGSMLPDCISIYYKGSWVFSHPISEATIYLTFNSSPLGTQYTVN